jgi:hypothetical protein
MKEIKIKVILDEEKDFTKFCKAVMSIKDDIPFIFEVEEGLEKKEK